MKFTNGYWLTRPEFTAESAKQLFDFRKTARSLTAYLPTRPVENHGGTLNGALLTLELSSPAENVVRVRVCHHKGGLRETPAFPAYMAEALGGCALVTSDDADAGEIAAAVQAARESSCIVLGTCNAHLKPGQLALMEALGALGKPMAVAALRNPYDLLHLPQGAAGIAAWEYTARALEALVAFLDKKCRFMGEIPLVYTGF